MAQGTKKSPEQIKETLEELSKIQDKYKSVEEPPINDTNEVNHSGNSNLSPCQVFEANVNNYLAQFGHQIPFTELVGFLELKLIELKESYRFTTEMNIRKNMEANEHGHTH